MKVLNFIVKGENPRPVLEISYGHRYISFRDYNDFNWQCARIGWNISDVIGNKLHVVSLQVQQRAAEKWKDIDATAKSLRLCVISNMLKVECCVNGSHSMDDVGLGAFGQCKTLPGLDCTFPGFVLQILHA